MCGICGFVKFQEGGISDAELLELASRLLVETERRGTDATGHCWVNQQGSLVVSKAPVPAYEFVETDEFYRLGEEPLPRLWLGHCRQGTGASPEDSNNNHPVFSKESGMAVVHNGIVHTMKRYRKDGQVDTEDILRAIEAKQGTTLERIQKGTKDLSGSVTFGLMVESEADRLYLARHKNPLALGLLADQGLIVIASTPEIIHASVAESHWLYGFFEIQKPYYEISVIQEVMDDTLVVVDVNSELKIEQYELEFAFDYKPVTVWKAGRQTTNYAESWQRVVD